MDKKILFLILSGILALPSVVSAQLHYYNTSYTLTGIVPKIEMTTGLIFGAIAVICFVIAGILFLTAQGDPEKLRSARSAFFWGIAGVVVGIIAFSIIAIVSKFIT